MNETLKKVFVQHLYECGAIKFGSFKLASHEKDPDRSFSPIYLDIGLPLSQPDDTDRIVSLLLEKIQGDSILFNILAGVPVKGSSLTDALKQAMRIPRIIPRKETKTHGTPTAIDGVFYTGQKVLVVDDVLTNGGSVLSAIKILKAHGLRVSDVLVLVDREQGGAQKLAKQGYTAHAVFTLSFLVDYGYRVGAVTRRQNNEVKAYMKQFST